MSNNLGQKLKKGAQQAIKQAQQVAKEELEKSVKQATEQTGVDKAIGADKAVIEHMYGASVSGGHTEGIEAEDKASSSSRLAQLEQEMAYFKRKREQELTEWKKQQDEKLKEGKQEAAQTVVFLPPSPRKGPVGPAGAHRKGGTGEMIRKKN